RIVLPSKPDKKPFLQGWAIVDNTVGEDWDGVELSLVAGAPHSFIQQLSQPYYGRRPTLSLPASVKSPTPPHAAALDMTHLAAPQVVGGVPGGVAGGVMGGVLGRIGTGSGGGTGGGTFGAPAPPPPIEAEMASVEEAREETEPEAVG